MLCFECAHILQRYCYVVLSGDKAGSTSSNRITPELCNDEYKMTVIRNMFDTCETALRLLHPFAPFLSEELWQRIPAIGSDAKPDSICIAEFPTAEKVSFLQMLFSVEIALFSEYILETV